MSERVVTLEEICVITLLRHHTLVEDIKYVPYRLIKRVLAKLKVDQLVKLEKTNFLLIFEDDEIWYNLIRKDFDPSFSYQFTNKKNEILQYFKHVITTYAPSSACEGTDTETLKNFFRPIVAKNSQGLYRVPCRLLYEKMRDDILEKDERIAAKVRETTHRIQQEKNRIQITAMVEPPSTAANKQKTRLLESKSKVFVSSLRDSQRRRQHFNANSVNIEKRVIDRVAFGGQAGVSTITAHTPSSTRTAPVAVPDPKTHESIPTDNKKEDTPTTTTTLPQKRHVNHSPKRKRSRLFGAPKTSRIDNCNIYIHER
ncbi:unnamed protein product [Kluyveromyces dobzhanskii CBS 2104]|uniref:Elongin-A n=1 Tax=Kluyveromyces dobzhanskii CBS 2104 TaxID=1427455 RepID=A0A0A8L784_9SACH|nr:unnamed protein product [Kluyveromyces dobzhanskii CBS 2104]